MSDEGRDVFDILFEKSFGKYQSKLSGTESEIVALKMVARHWWDAGLKEGVAIAYSMGTQGLDKAKAWIDPDFASEHPYLNL